MTTNAKKKKSNKKKNNSVKLPCNNEEVRKIAFEYEDEWKQGNYKKCSSYTIIFFCSFII